MNPYQDFVVLRRRFCYLDELQHIRWSVLSLYDCFHIGYSSVLQENHAGLLERTTREAGGKYRTESEAEY